MNWNEFFLLVILFNTISGTCILGVWYLLKRLLVKSNDILLFYRLLKVVIVFIASSFNCRPVGREQNGLWLDRLASSEF